MAEPIHYIDTIYYDLALTANLMKTLGIQLFEQLELGISPLEHATLDTIYCNEGICQRDLAKLILKDRANTGRILDSLEEKGLITRFIDLKNNRLVKKMQVTESGQLKLEEINEKIQCYLKSINNQISEEEIAQLQTSLQKFQNKLLEVVDTHI